MKYDQTITLFFYRGVHSFQGQSEQKISGWCEISHKSDKDMRQIVAEAHTGADPQDGFVFEGTETIHLSFTDRAVSQTDYVQAMRFIEQTCRSAEFSFESFFTALAQDVIQAAYWNNRDRALEACFLQADLSTQTPEVRSVWAFMQATKNTDYFQFFHRFFTAFHTQLIVAVRIKHRQGLMRVVLGGPWTD